MVKYSSIQMTHHQNGKTRNAKAERKCSAQHNSKHRQSHFAMMKMVSPQLYKQSKCIRQMFSHYNRISSYRAIHFKGCQRKPPSLPKTPTLPRHPHLLSLASFATPAPELARPRRVTLLLRPPPLAKASSSPL